MKRLAAIAGAVAAVATACEAFVSRYDVEFHLEPNRPSVSRVWGENEPIPERVAEEF